MKTKIKIVSFQKSHIGIPRILLYYVHCKSVGDIFLQFYLLFFLKVTYLYKELFHQTLNFSSIRNVINEANPATAIEYLTSCVEINKYIKPVQKVKHFRQT